MESFLQEVPQEYYDKFKCLPNYQCPHCQTDMMIAGRYDKSEKTVGGVSKPVLHECYQCGKRVTPKSKYSS